MTPKLEPGDPAAQIVQTVLGGVSMGVNNRFAQVGDVVAGDKHVQILIYTGPAQPMDGEALHWLEHAYRSEVAARAEIWRTRYAAIPIAALPAPAAQAPVFIDRDDLTIAGVRSGSARVPPEAGALHESVVFSQLREGIAQLGDILLLGPPGGGKTTALWRLALDLAEAGLGGARETPLPVVVRLGGRRPAQSLLELLTHELAQAALEGSDGRRYPLEAHRALAPLVPRLLGSGRLVMLWDGLNEAPRELVASTAQEIAAFWRDHPGPPSGPRNVSVVTCRADDYTEIAEQHGDPLAHLSQATIQALDSDTVRQIVIGRLGELRGQALMEALARPEHRALATLARTPLLLAMLCRIFQDSGALPSNRGEVLQAFVERRFAWEEQRSAGDWGPADALRRALAGLAYAMTASEGRGTIVSWDWASRELRRAAPGVPPERIRELARRSELLETLPDGVRFSHQLLQEYFAALALRELLAGAARRSKLPVVGGLARRELARYASPGRRTGWEETLLLLSGLEGERGPARALVRAFLSDPLDAARLLIEGGAADPALLDEVRAAALARVRDLDVIARLRLEAGKALGMVGDSRPGVCTLEPDWCEVAAGPFLLGSDEEAWFINASDVPLRTVDIPMFFISRYPVTNAQWQRFAEAGYDERRWWSDAGWHWLQATRRPRQSTLDRRPNAQAVELSWYEASAYCRWLSHQLGYPVRLLSEAEWEKAARGEDGRRYPWGDVWNDELEGVFDHPLSRARAAVGTQPAGASPCGALDMIAPLGCWTASPWTENHRESDGTGVAADGAEFIAVRGGFDNIAAYMSSCTSRAAVRPSARDRRIGLRLATDEPRR